MTRRFDVGPALVTLAAIALLVSLFLEWYGPATAWDAFEVVDVLLAAGAVAAGSVALGMLLSDVAYLDRRWLPVIALGVLVLVAAAIIDPPPAAGDDALGTGAWIAFASAVVMVVGTVMSFGRISVAVSVEGRDTRERVAVIDHRQDTTETAAVPGRARER
jgi:hypothetical protein